ncbi:hypothetical protein JKP88DRAFT_232056 [Tribonema minus]|uniref:Uncharacterized protein n=1 Tax=Tribonema minus TaxID=303371 RepID=A0A835ZG24_9STRA|nr:hypothetical protein JKP88DRAFT_232056 [Tribonema minus]
MAPAAAAAAATALGPCAAAVGRRLLLLGLFVRGLPRRVCHGILPPVIDGALDLVMVVVVLLDELGDVVVCDADWHQGFVLPDSCG